MVAFDRQRQMELNIEKTLINVIGMDSAKFGKAITITRNGESGKGIGERGMGNGEC